MQLNKLVVSALAGVLLALQGCGGGGGSGSGGATIAAAPPTPSAEGAYYGTLSDGRQHYTLVLENGQLYTLYGSTISNVFAVSGFLQGNGSSNNGSYSASDIKDASANSNTMQSASLSATYTAGSSFNGTLTEGSSNVSLTGTGLGAAVYSYNTAASVAPVAGTWNMTSLHGYATTLDISASGAFTGTSSGCAFSGTMKPRSSGKNVLDVALTFGAAPCILAGQSLNGIAINYALANGQHQLVIAALDQARTSSSAFVGIR
jgi:hypothetical protein